MNRILLLEDDESLIDGLKYTLEKNGFSPDIARTTAQARSLLEQGAPYDLLLDVTLPDGTGFDVCTWVRSRDRKVPIIFLTASDEELSIIRGLDSGGDDYMTKPFRLGELLSRIRALLRRTGLSEPAEGLQCGSLFLDFTKSQALLNDQPLDLTRNAGQVLPRSRILDELWDGNGSFVDDNTLSVYIRRLREKTEKEPSQPEHLITVRGFGYQWKP